LSGAVGAAAARVSDALEPHRELLWSLCYRLTGDAADADDLVQETFARALQRPPPDREAPLRPWLTRVAVNLALDHLRRRKRRPYPGVWMPAPVETGELASPEPGPAARYDLLESATMAFLLALEALTPAQRAVLLLRDVFDEPAREIAEALGIGEVNVRVILLRARARMSAYDAARVVPTRALQQSTRKAVGEFMAALGEGDLPRARSMLTASVRAAGDGAGRYKAGLRWVVGRQNVSHLYDHIVRTTPVAASELRLINGLPALVLSLQPAPGLPERAVIQLDVDASGQVREIRAVLAPEKLTHVAPRSG
jgi:RNA polymerase sigma factor (sigma-70 family)